MGKYVDGFIVPVPKNKIEDYLRVAHDAGKLFREYGALEYVECLADDVKPGKVTSFPQSVLATDDETVVFSWITFESREHRDKVMAQVMNDPRMKMDPASMPFDGQRMIFGGFEIKIAL